MTDTAEMDQRMAEVARLLKDKHGLTGTSPSDQLRKAVPVLPRRLRRSVQLLVEADAKAENPRLAMTIDDSSHARAARDLVAHLQTIDVADRRRGWWLGMLGGMAFNLLTALVILLVTLRLLGHI